MRSGAAAGRGAQRACCLLLRCCSAALHVPPGSLTGTLEPCLAQPTCTTYSAATSQPPGHTMEHHQGEEAAGSVAAAPSDPNESESHSSGAQEESQQQGGSVNWGQATAQSPVGAGSPGRADPVPACAEIVPPLTRQPQRPHSPPATEGAPLPNQPRTPRPRRHRVWRTHLGRPVGPVGRRRDCAVGGRSGRCAAELPQFCSRRAASSSGSMHGRAHDSSDAGSACGNNPCANPCRLGAGRSSLPAAAAHPLPTPLHPAPRSQASTRRNHRRRWAAWARRARAAARCRPACTSSCSSSRRSA